jgi:uncharacterized damage-inducible protein DinB
MKLKSLLVVSCVLVSAVSSFAGQSATAQDPISGGWADDGVTLLELKFDGKRSVSGTIVAGRPGNLAPIRTGTFDRSTGILKLEGEAKHPDSGAAVKFVIEGKVDNDLLTVTAAFDSEKATKTLTRVSAQRPAGAEAALAMRKSFSEVSGWVTRAAELVPADKYTYQPTQSVRTFGQMIGHIADGYVYYCSRAAGRTVEWSDAMEKGSMDKAALVQKLKQSVEACNAAYAGASQMPPLVNNLGHTSLHYGNIITYMRMLGLVPPSS